MLESIEKLLRLPELKDLKREDFDGKKAGIIQRRIFDRKKILRTMYREYCRPFLESARRAPDESRMIEIGSGISALKREMPDIICTDVIDWEWIDLTCSAYNLPFKSGSLDRIFMMFVCHHLGRFEEFLDDAYRCLKSGGELVVLEPAVTPFSTYYYKYIHMDNIDTKTKDWGFEGNGRVSDSNVALPWIVFCRDQDRFVKRYPRFVVELVEYNTFLTYLLSGGLRLRPLLPWIMLAALFYTENRIIQRVASQLAVNMVVRVRKN